MLLAVFLLISLTLNVVNGIEMCAGPYELPEFGEVTTIPVYEYRNSIINEVKISVAVRSKSPVYMSWFWIGKGRERKITKDDKDFRSSVTGSSDRYIFKLHAKLEESVANVTEIFSDIAFALQVAFDCNSVGFTMNLGKLIELSRAGLTMPTITSLPRGRYIIDGKGFYTPEIKWRFSNGPGERSPKVEPHCRQIMERRNGRLRLLSFMEEKPHPLFESKSIELDDLGVAETTCKGKFSGGIESYYVSMYAGVRLEFPIGTDHFSLGLSLVTEFRKSGITKPAVLLSSSSFAPPIERKGEVLLIPTDKTTTNVICLAEAASMPFIAAGRLTRGGEYQLLKKDRLQDGIYYVSLNTADFSLKSPQLLEEEEYICSAASGQSVTSQKFKLLRYGAVQVTSNRTDSMPLEAVENKQYSLTCEATGVPQPDIKFYWTPRMSVPFHVKLYKKINQDREIHDSNVFETTTWAEGNQTYGRIIVKDMKKIIASLPSDFWKVEYIYEIVCFASNEYSFDTKVSGHFYKPFDWDSNHRVNATSFSLFK